MDTHVDRHQRWITGIRVLRHQLLGDAMDPCLEVHRGLGTDTAKDADRAHRQIRDANAGRGPKVRSSASRSHFPAFASASIVASPGDCSTTFRIFFFVLVLFNFVFLLLSLRKIIFRKMMNENLQKTRF